MDLMHPDQKQYHRKELVLFEKDNPRCLANLVPDGIANLMRKLWNSEERNLLRFTERELYACMVQNNKTPRAVDTRIRLQFWLEYDRIQADVIRNPKMNFAYVIGFLIPKETFYLHYINDPYYLAWMLCPPTDYLSKMEECLSLTVDQIRHIIEHTPITTRNGEVDKSYLNFLMKVQERFHRQLKSAKDAEEPDEPLEELPKPITEAELIREKKKRIEELRKQAGLEAKAPEAPRVDVDE